MDLHTRRPRRAHFHVAARKDESKCTNLIRDEAVAAGPVPPPSCVGAADLLADFEKEPRAPLRLISPGIDQTGSRIVLCRVCDFLRTAKRLDHV